MLHQLPNVKLCICRIHYKNTVKGKDIFLKKMKEKYVVCGKGFPNVGQHTAYPGFSLPQYYFLGSLSGGGLKNVLLDCCLVLEGNLKVLWWLTPTLDGMFFFS